MTDQTTQVNLIGGDSNESVSQLLRRIRLTLGNVKAESALKRAQGKKEVKGLKKRIKDTKGSLAVSKKLKGKKRGRPKLSKAEKKRRAKARELAKKPIL
jgi:hypothetical protein